MSDIKKYLVTGGFGNIGLPLVNLLNEDKHYVFVIDNLSSKDSLERFDQMNFRTRVTYVNLEYFEHMWSDVEFDCIVHLAGYSNHENADSEYIQAYEDNILNTLRVIHRCIETNTPLIYLFWPNIQPGLLQFLHTEAIRLIEYYMSTKGLQAKIINTQDFSSNEAICRKIISEL